MSKAPSKAKPAISPSNKIAQIPPDVSNKIAPFICKVKCDVETSIHALGFALAKMGSLVICKICDDIAKAVPSNAIIKPESHQSGLNWRFPEIFAPYRPFRVAATSGSRNPAIKYPKIIPIIAPIMVKIIISIVTIVISVLIDTPIDLIERIIALRCSKARPIVL